MASRLTQEEIDEIFTMYRSGKYYLYEIAEWVGCCLSTIERVLKKESEKRNMVMTTKPYGAINDKAIRYRFEQDGKYYVVDLAYNKYQVNESVYKKLTCPIKKYEKKVRY
jgi:hypothetical protein